MELNLVWTGFLLVGLLSFSWGRKLLLIVPLLALALVKLLESGADGVFGSD